ncbi:Pycsar system effector family protein [Mucilaginibacter auburnensis]|uniref:HD domain-containing protein n=1 Tax=Mucilaginibacter auburnensis TaxID=1457233 RepID=A0A2H9VR65_9SPHI|nr:Pycsar system effector family protein [Mucilaginibacter auburnensis]PJJ83320.1 HD domain-containing protein [Mucilaginibacter auburnensis]
MNFQQLLHEIKQYTLNYFETHEDATLIYHDIEHTRRVVQQTANIADHYQLSDEDYFVVMAAAWFHDLGYFVNKTEHEENGARMAAEHLQRLGVDEAVIEKIKGCILATKMPQRAVGLLQEIVCDADLFHLGTEQFADRSKLLKKEIEAIKGIKIDKKTWREKNIEMLRSHQYYTDFVKLQVKDQYEKNLQKLLSKQHEEGPEPIQKSDSAIAPQFVATGEKKAKADRPERGIETMFRITSGNNQRLSDMADNKAQILITVNSIILSAIISLVLRKLDEAAFLTIPTLILLSVSLASMIFSILATRPAIPSGVFTQDDIDSKRVNLLFFGNFYKMHLEEYAAGMQKVMDDKEFLYGTLVRDVYSQGVVLGRKYRLLRVAYNVFMFGLIISVLAYIIALIINNHLS